jgi:hypothetical protein
MKNAHERLADGCRLSCGLCAGHRLARNSVIQSSTPEEKPMERSSIKQIGLSPPMAKTSPGIRLLAKKVACRIGL